MIVSASFRWYYPDQVQRVNSQPSLPACAGDSTPGLSLVKNQLNLIIYEAGCKSQIVAGMPGSRTQLPPSGGTAILKTVVPTGDTFIPINLF